MKMVRLISMFIYFLREIIYDAQTEGEFKSSKFNTRKFILLVATATIFLMSGFIGYRAYVLNADNKALRKKIADLPKVCKIQASNSSDSAKAKKDTDDRNKGK